MVCRGRKNEFTKNKRIDCKDCFAVHLPQFFLGGVLSICFVWESLRDRSYKGRGLTGSKWSLTRVESEYGKVTVGGGEV